MSDPGRACYLDPSPETGATFLKRDIQGEIVMLNLLRFREIADYENFAQLAPPAPISGRAAYEKYIEHTLPFLEASGGELTYVGTGGSLGI